MFSSDATWLARLTTKIMYMSVQLHVFHSNESECTSASDVTDISYFYAACNIAVKYRAYIVDSELPPPIS